MPPSGRRPAAIRPRIVSSVNAAGSTAATSLPAKRRRDARVGRRADRVGRRRSSGRARSGRSRRRRRSGRRRARSSSRRAWSPIRRSTSSASAFANRRTSGNESSGLIGASTCRPVAPEVFGYDASPSSSITSRTTSAISRTNGHCPSDGRVEVDQQVVGPLDLRDARVPGVQLDAAEVRDPGERGGVVDHREHGRMAARERDRDLVDVVRMVRRHALLVEEVALDAVREALHVERPPPEVRQRELGDAEVVGDEVALRQPARGEERPCRGSRPGRRGGRRATRFCPALPEASIVRWCSKDASRSRT